MPHVKTEDGTHFFYQDWGSGKSGRIPRPPDGPF